jgi:hypothetical protein
VLATYGLREQVELFVVDLGEYRDAPQCGSLVGRTRFGQLPFSDHERT